MTVDGVDHVTVVGAGSMGHGITEVVALAGYRVTMLDVDREQVDEGYEEIEWSLRKLADSDRIDQDPETVLERVSTAVDIAEPVRETDFVIEAVPERLDLKADIFGDLDELADDDTILASNTSSLSITDIAAATDRPDRVVGTHFFNPPVKMDLVEVIYGEETSEGTATATYDFVESLGKTPIYVRKDVSGFVVNSVLAPFSDEAAWMVSREEATVREADATMVHERGYPMGPFELSDLTGIDIGYHMREEAGKPIPPIVEEKVEAEELGRKTEQGYYDYSGDGEPDYTADDASDDFDWLRIEARMINEAAKLVGDDVATPEDVDTGLRLGAGFPDGPCRRGDEIGLDAVLEKLESLHEESGDDRYAPADFLVELVEDGHTGEDAGEGFYEYGDPDGGEDYRTLEVEHGDDGLLEIRIDRPERLNAINAVLRDELVDLLERVDEDDVRCVTIEGVGDRAFSAGADVTDFAGLEPHEIEPTEVYRVVDSFPRPVVAKIDGYCLGGGFELALACDLRIATLDSEFGFPEINLGLLPGGGGTQRAMRMIGEPRAKELVFRGNHISAERAAEWGLINRAIPEEEYGSTVEEFVDDLVSGPPVALRKAKHVMNDGQDEDMDAALRMESQAFSLLLTTEDMEEGGAAYREDREPEFEGK